MGGQARLHARIMREFACGCVYCGESGEGFKVSISFEPSLTRACNDYVSL